MTLRLLWTLVAAQEASVVLLGGGLWLLPCLETSGKWDLIVWTAQVTFETTVYCHLLWCYFCIVSTQVPRLLTWNENLCVGLAGSSGTGGDARWKRERAQFQDVIYKYASNCYLALKDFVEVWTYGLPQHSVVFKRHIVSGWVLDSMDIRKPEFSQMVNHFWFSR